MGPLVKMTDDNNLFHVLTVFDEIVRDRTLISIQDRRSI
jgi:hypothetical protein